MRFSSIITAVDAHACGEPGRVITGGVLDVPGKTMFEKKIYLETQADHTPVEVRGLGTVTVDVAYGGMFYVIADAAALGFRLVPDEGRDITRVTELIKAAASEQLPVVHPDQPGFAGITIGQLSGPAHDPANSWRNVVTVSTGAFDWERPASWTGAIDRSPCGTGTSAKMATLHAKGEL